MRAVRFLVVTSLLGAGIVSAPAADVAPPADDLVQTPVGVLPRSHCHLVEPGQILFYHAEDDSVEIRDADGRTARRDAPDGDSTPPGVGSGWIEDAYWYNNHSAAVRQFWASWGVPAPPATWDGQIVYLFNGMTNAAHILQPVLQFGASEDGGGAYYSVASWYVADNGNAYFTRAVPVAPGTQLSGGISFLSRSGSSFSYLCQFAGIGGTGLQVNGVGELTTCYETLEVYNMVQWGDYPQGGGTQFYNILVELATGYPNLHWTPQVYYPTAPFGVGIVSNSPTNGSVILYY